jgi:hypothetical protein
MAVIAILAALGAAWVAYMRSATVALSLLIVPVLVYLLLLQFSNRVELLQTTGLLYPAILCGLGILVTQTSMSGSRIFF